MASNYFTRPKGLHPTPSACYPPRPPAAKGLITGGATAIPNPVQQFQLTQIQGVATNAALAPGEPLTTVWTLPGLTGGPIPEITNAIPFSFPRQATGPPGTYSGSLKVTWSNGQVRTFAVNYTIIP